MQLNNPIILKELIQAARHRRLYAVRALLPALALLLPLPDIVRTLRYIGQDWRMIAETGRSFFEYCVWLELAAFSLLAFLYSMAAVRDEWSSRTMEVLCASPLSASRIMYGKFAAVLSRVLLVGLALLPVMCILFHVARVPPEMALGCMAIILGSTLFFGSVGLLQAVLFGDGRAAPFAWFGILVPYFLVVSFLDGYVFVGADLLDAIIPPRALYLVLDGRGSGVFALASLVELSALSLFGLALAPWLFRRAFERHIGAGATPRWFPTFKRWLAGRRPKLKAYQNPFYWQEKGPATSFLRRVVWIVYLVTLPFLLMMKPARSYDYDLEFARGLLTAEGLIVLFIASAFYGATVFARDKKWGRAQALLLTGRSPLVLLRAKIAAAYWALWPSMAVVGAICLWTASDIFGERDATAATVMLLEMLLFGPLFGVIIGMVFSLAARSVTGAILGVLGAVPCGAAIIWILFGITPNHPPGFGSALFFGIAAGIMILTPLRLKVWALSIVLALCFWTVAICCIAIAETRDWDDAGWCVFGGSVVAWIILAFWYRLAQRNFEPGMMEGAKT
jgi:ABC-type transport system involved in multi-copper enzyme maturation permease subunit